MIAALYVQGGGCYCGLPDVDPWDEARDARGYAGPHPVVAHPPCKRWGRYARGCPRSGSRRFAVGDDGGCFAAALASVRAWGGVLEHPAHSLAWRTFGLIAPPAAGGWVAAGDWRGWVCAVEQGHYGHPAPKPTWLYVCSARARARLLSRRWRGDPAPPREGSKQCGSAPARSRRRRSGTCC